MFFNNRWKSSAPADVVSGSSQKKAFKAIYKTFFRAIQDMHLHAARPPTEIVSFLHLIELCLLLPWLIIANISCIFISRFLLEPYCTDTTAISSNTSQEQVILQRRLYRINAKHESALTEQSNRDTYSPIELDPKLCPQLVLSMDKPELAAHPHTAVQFASIYLGP